MERLIILSLHTATTVLHTYKVSRTRRPPEENSGTLIILWVENRIGEYISPLLFCGWSLPPEKRCQGLMPVTMVIFSGGEGKREVSPYVHVHAVAGVCTRTLPFNVGNKGFLFPFSFMRKYQGGLPRWMPMYLASRRSLNVQSHRPNYFIYIHTVKSKCEHQDSKQDCAAFYWMWTDPAVWGGKRQKV